MTQIKHTDPKRFRSLMNRVFHNNSKDASLRVANVKAVLKTYDGHIDESEKDDIASFIIFGLKDVSLGRRYEVKKEALTWAQ